MARDPLPEGWPIQQLAEPIGVFAVEGTHDAADWARDSIEVVGPPAGADTRAFFDLVERIQREVADTMRAAMLTDILTIDDFVRRRPEQSASDKSIDLLKRWLSPAQLEEFEKNGTYWFSVVGSAGGRYRIMRMTAYNITDEAGQKLCLVPAGASAVGDVMLAQKIAFETDEPGALRKANRPTHGAGGGAGGDCHITNCTFEGNVAIGVASGGVINYDDA